MHKMKVLFILNGLPHYFIKILEKLKSRDIEVIVLTPSSTSCALGKEVYQVDYSPTCKVIQTPEYKTWYRKPFFRNIGNIIQEEKPNLIVTGWPYFLGFVMKPHLLFRLKKLSIKLVIREIPFQTAPFNAPIRYYKENPIIDEDLNVENPHLLTNKIKYVILALVRKIAYSVADAALAYNPDAHLIIKSFGMPKEKIFVTLNSPDTDEIFKVKNILLQENITLIPNSAIHVGRLVKWKRVDLLIEAFDIIVKKIPDAQLYIVGDGPEKQNLVRLVEMLNLQPNVTFCGKIYNYDELGRLFLKTQVYVLAGMGGLSINEAMAFGKPVICSVCDGSEKYLIHDKFNGLYIQQNNSQDLAEKLLYLFQNPDIATKMGKESEKIIADKININTVSNRYIEALNVINEMSRSMHQHNKPKKIS